MIRTRNRLMVVAMMMAAAMLLPAAAGADDRGFFCRFVDTQAFEEAPRVVWTSTATMNPGETIEAQTTQVGDEPYDVTLRLLGQNFVTVVEDVGPAGSTLSVTVPTDPSVLGYEIIATPNLVTFELSCGFGTDDSDGDGIDDQDDLCPDSDFAEGTGDLPNRYRVNADGDFVDTNDDWSGVTIEDTGGCTAAEIIGAMGLGNGHVEFGITIGPLNNWVKSLSS